MCISTACNPSLWCMSRCMLGNQASTMQYIKHRHMYTYIYVYIYIYIYIYVILISISIIINDNIVVTITGMLFRVYRAIMLLFWSSVPACITVTVDALFYSASCILRSLVFAAGSGSAINIHRYADCIHYQPSECLTCSWTVYHRSCSVLIPLGIICGLQFLGLYAQTSNKQKFLFFDNESPQLASLTSLEL